jgi:hypothetical protein
MQQLNVPLGEHIWDDLVCMSRFMNLKSIEVEI